MPLISVLLPAYNHKLYISDTLNSLLNQTEADLEIVAVDDGATDGTAEIIDSFAERDRRIKVIHQANSGVAAALNTAIRHANGQWLVWCGSDDVVPPSAYSRLLRKASCVDIVIGEFCEFTDAGGMVRVRTPKLFKRDCFDALFAMPAMWNKMIRRSFVEKNNLWFPDVQLCEDLIFLTRIAIYKPRCAFIARDIYHYRNNPQGYSQSMTHTYSLAYFLSHIQGRHQVLKLCEEAGLTNGQNYVFHDSIRYLASYIPRMRQEDLEPAMTALRELLALHDWESESRHFQAVFGLPYDVFLQMSTNQYITFLQHQSPYDYVLNQYRAGDVGLQYAMRCVRAWLIYKLEHLGIYIDKERNS